MSVAETTFFLNKRHLFYQLKPQIFAFRSTDINIVFSDIRHENKVSLVKKFGPLKQSDKKYCKE